MQEKNFNKKGLIEVGSSVVILSILIYLSTSVPLNLIINFVLPLPAVYVYVKYDFKYFGALLLAAFIVCIASMDMTSAISIFIIIAVISTILGYCIKNKVKTSITFAIISVAYIVFWIIYFTVLINIFIGIDYSTLLESISKMFQHTIDDVKTIYLNNGMSQSQINSVIDPLKDVFSKEALRNLIPSLIIVGSAVYAYIECAITIYFLRRMKLQVPKMIQFTKIHMPNVLVAFGIIGISIGIIMDSFNIGPGDIIYTTVMIVGDGALLICGISLIVSVLKNRVHINNALMTIIIILTLIIPITAYGYIFLGLVDAFVDFRKVAYNNSINKK